MLVTVAVVVDVAVVVVVVLVVDTAAPVEGWCW